VGRIFNLHTQIEVSFCAWIVDTREELSGFVWLEVCDELYVLDSSLLEGVKSSEDARWTWVCYGSWVLKPYLVLLIWLKNWFYLVKIFLFVTGNHLAKISWAAVNLNTGNLQSLLVELEESRWGGHPKFYDKSSVKDAFDYTRIYSQKVLKVFH